MSWGDRANSAYTHISIVRSIRHGHRRHLRFGQVKAEVIANFASAHQKPSSGPAVMHPAIHCCGLRLVHLGTFGYMICL